MLWPAGLLALAIIACSVYANLSYLVTDPADYRFFPPFEEGLNANRNTHLGGENYNIARALVAGDGFANPFGRQTGLTAWMPPVVPALFAGLLWVCDGERSDVTVLVVLLQALTLVATGVLVIALAGRTNAHFAPWFAALVFLAALLARFRSAFQITHDAWLVLGTLSLLVAWLSRGQPLRSWPQAAGWGLFGGFAALVSPVVGFTWGVVSLAAAWRSRAWRPLAVASLVAAVVLTPWTARNYARFGRLIPVKSNLAYELYQSQYLTDDGVVRGATFAHHPYGAPSGPEGKEYEALGEPAFMERKFQQFEGSVRAAPREFARRVANRALAATLLYVPFSPEAEERHPWALWVSRCSHPLPFLSLIILLATARHWRLDRAECVLIGVYSAYLLPYVVASCYERYLFPLAGVNVLLVVFAAMRLGKLIRGVP
jgi:hypothetical protein